MPSSFVALMLVGAAGGCATVHPPRNVDDPVAAYVTDYGIHSAIVLPVGPGRYVEYAFGDYGYAALNRDSPFDAIGALLMSGTSGFGRSYMGADPRDGLPDLPRTPTRIQRLTVSRAKVDRLLEQLEARYDRGEQPSHFNAVTGIHWVRDGQHYSLFNSCNHLTARSLEALGCEVYGLPILSKFQFDGGTAIGLDPHDRRNNHLPPPKAGGPL